MTRIIASPDFGASGAIALVVLVVWAIVIVLVISGVILGRKLLGNNSPEARRIGILLLVVSGLVPLSCCLGPPYAIRIIYGNYPIDGGDARKIQEGMSSEEVLALLGRPHEQYKHSEDERWYYWMDSFGAASFVVVFGPDGHVIRAHHR